jgi:hypothetical protein
MSNRWARHSEKQVTCNKYITIFVGSAKGQIQLRKCESRRKDDVKVHFKKVGIVDLDWIILACDKDQ